MNALRLVFVLLDEPGGHSSMKLLKIILKPPPNSKIEFGNLDSNIAMRFT